MRPLAPCLLAGLASLAACGGGADPAPAPAPVGPPATLISPASGPDDAVVATVAGRPVWGACVAGQVARGAARDRGEAVRQCVDFELLAQAAAARGLATDPDVIAETRRAAVSREIALSFEARYPTPAEVAPAIDRAIARNGLVRPEFRAATFARVEVPSGPDGEARARAAADDLARELAARRGMFAADVASAAARPASDGLRRTSANVPPSVREGLEPAWAAALYAIPEVGSSAPAPVRSRFGWDVIVLTELVPARTYTHEQAAAEIFPEVRRNYFQAWSHQLVDALGARVERFPERLDDEAGEAGGAP